MDTRVDAREGEIARLRAETVEYGRLLRKSGGEIAVLETTVRELRAEKAEYFRLVQKDGAEVRELEREVEKWRDVCKTLAVPFTRTPGLVGRVASCPY